MGEWSSKRHIQSLADELRTAAGLPHPLTQRKNSYRVLRYLRKYIYGNASTYYYLCTLERKE
jgi:hypothetical protein